MPATSTWSTEPFFIPTGFLLRLLREAAGRATQIPPKQASDPHLHPSPLPADDHTSPSPGTRSEKPSEYGLDTVFLGASSTLESFGPACTDWDDFDQSLLQVLSWSATKLALRPEGTTTSAGGEMLGTHDASLACLRWNLCTLLGRMHSQKELLWPSESLSPLRPLTKGLASTTKPKTPAEKVCFDDTKWLGQ